jgi:CheY-like chemotaxis protein
VILDIGLPDMTGHNLARALRQFPETSGARLIAVSGYGQDADRRASLEAGCNAHLTKPVDLKRLKELLDGVAPRSRRA